MSVKKVIIFVAITFCYTQNTRVLAQRNTCTVRATARYQPATKIVETVQNEEWAEDLENDFVVRKIKKSKRNIATDYEVVHNENGEVWTQQKINENESINEDQIKPIEASDFRAIHDFRHVKPRG